MLGPESRLGRQQSATFEAANASSNLMRDTVESALTMLGESLQDAASLHAMPERGNAQEADLAAR